MLEAIRRLFAQVEWADQRTLGALEQGSTADPTIGKLFGHILGAEHIWLNRMRQLPQSVAVWPELSVPERAQLLRDSAAGYRELLASLDDAGLDRGVTYRNTKGVEYTTPVREILIHVAMHGAHHRGQIALLLRAGGTEPPVTDYVAFSREYPLDIP